MEQNHENSFWKSNMRTVPGRPSPKNDHKAGKGTSSTSSFENYQKSVSDAWNWMSEDELTKEYCILSTDSDSKLPPRRPPNVLKAHKNQIPVVHKASSSSFPTSSNNLTTANSNMPPHSNSSRSLSLDGNKAENSPPSSSVDQQQKQTLSAVSEKSNIEYG